MFIYKIVFEIYLQKNFFSSIELNSFVCYISVMWFVL